MKKIRKDNYMYLVVTECYELLKYILDILVVGDIERRYSKSLIVESVLCCHLYNCGNSLFYSLCFCIN